MESDRRGRGLTSPHLLTTGGRLLLLVLGLSGCGSAASDPASTAAGPHVGGAIAAASTRPAAAAPEPARAAPPPSIPRGPTTAPLSTTLGPRCPEASHATHAAPEARPPAPALSSDRSPCAERIAAERAQQEAWTQWYAALRESPDVGVRLQALDQWAQQPGALLDPVTYALVDGDEAVRARAQDLYTQQLTREAAAAPPVQEEGERGQTGR